MKTQKKIINIILFSLQKSAFEIKGSLGGSKINLKYACTITVVVALTCVYLWSWYRLDLILREQSTVPIKINIQQYSNESNVGCVFPEVDPYSAVALKYNVEWPKVVCEGYDWVECNVSMLPAFAPGHSRYNISGEEMKLNTILQAEAFSYHDLIFASYKIRPPKAKPTIVMRRSFRNFNNPLFMSDLNNIDWTAVFSAGTVDDKMSECRVTQHILDTMKNIVCYYRDIIYVHDHKYTISDPVQLIDNEVFVLNRSDSFKVSCTGYEKNGFGLLATRWHGYKASIRPVTPLPSPKRNDSLNILIIAFDSTARSGFIRKMPKSFNMLIEKLDAVVLEGYNIVGDGTPDALFPILSGRTELQHDTYARQRVSKSTYLDPERFIFHTAKEDGYHTAYYEDMPWIGSFQYRYNGFSKRPADHYIRSFFMEESKNGAKWYQGVKGRYCVGDKPSFLVLLDLTRQFMKVQGKKFCFTFIADISHDDFNRIATADEDFAGFLRHINESGYLKDTMVVVMGDHGPRERPDALTNLKANARVLTTPFDIHTTVLDAMALGQHASDFVVPNASLKRGLSLLKPIPRTRTCEEAEVTPHWCVCVNTESHSVAVTDPMHSRSVDALVRYINNITQEMRSLCAVRKLTSTLWVTRQTPHASSAGNSSHAVYYQALVILSPGRAAFEASLQYDGGQDRFTVSEKDISRVSAYGTEPACVSATQPHLNKYCYCI